MIDIDYSTFTGAVFWLSLLSVFAGTAVNITGIKPTVTSALHA